jgi:hypothetical protein
MKKSPLQNLGFYISNILEHLVLTSYKRRNLQNLLNTARQRADYMMLLERVEYYNKLAAPTTTSAKAIKIRDLSWLSNVRTVEPYDGYHKINSFYYYDAMKYLDYFPNSYHLDYYFGDLIDVPEYPAFIKSRPIEGMNTNSIVLKLDRLRHFRFLTDPVPYVAKKNMALFRGPCYQQHRLEFIEACFDLPNTNVGDIRKDASETRFYKPSLTLREHLQYKYILSVEGNDVATNLKWIMSSNSLCFMRKPKYETWFMEGKLIPDYHYVLLNDDYSNLSEKIDYYNSNTTAALEIICNAHKWVEQFKNIEVEELISLLVIEKYFVMSQQRDKGSSSK